MAEDEKKIHSQEVNLLLLQIADGHQPAFNSLVAMHWKRVFSHAMTYVQCYTIAEELTQDVFLKIWQYREKLTEILHFDDYLFIVSRNLLISAIRKKIDSASIEPSTEHSETLWLPDQQMEMKELHSLILKGVDALSPQQQQVFKLGKMEGLSYDQIAESMQITKRTVRFHMALALNSLRIYIHQHNTKHLLAGLVLLLCLNKG
ncbi:RNA polymerase sigma factor [Pinibacter soli]|uniref:Sigma-70 family RNA polymerase sigma factor n=1 Tax=Pinibacter soli TaxID=3044211 RepID=A0ABT6RBP6_9BACT|nr:sigma-70 family RNA polymerase sigma factor [Pinibacter soli]MDI3319806.1 sigma-70 family RNA polymerase sigma factor [Pinibacter soli]